MTDALDAVSLLAEAFTWIGFSLGALLFLIGVIALALSARWVKTDGVVIAGPPAVESFRWVDRDGEVQEGIDEAPGDAPRQPGDEITVYFDSWRPWRGRLDDPQNDGKALRIAGGVLLGIGLLGTVVSLVLMFVDAS